MRKLTGDEGKAVLLAQELLALNALPDLLEDAIKTWLLEILGLTTPPEWVMESRDAALVEQGIRESLRGIGHQEYEDDEEKRVRPGDLPLGGAARATERRIRDERG